MGNSKSYYPAQGQNSKCDIKRHKIISNSERSTTKNESTRIKAVFTNMMLSLWHAGSNTLGVLCTNHIASQTIGSCWEIAMTSNTNGQGISQSQLWKKIYKTRSVSMSHRCLRGDFILTYQVCHQKAGLRQADFLFFSLRYGLHGLLSQFLQKVHIFSASVMPSLSEVSCFRITCRQKYVKQPTFQCSSSNWTQFN